MASASPTLVRRRTAQPYPDLSQWRWPDDASGKTATGLLVLLSPRSGSLVVAARLGANIVNLPTAESPKYYDIALRDFGLFVGAITLNRLATAFGVTTVASEFEQRSRMAA